MKRGVRSQAERGSWQYGHAPDGYAVVDGKLVVPEETRATFEVMKRIIWEYARAIDGGLGIAALPVNREEPGVDEIDAEVFRAAVLEAWTDQPSAERRSALAQLLRQVTLTPGGVTSTYGDCHH